MGTAVPSARTPATCTGQGQAGSRACRQNHASNGQINKHGP
jgi:hypothetical protein